MGMLKNASLYPISFQKRREKITEESKELVAEHRRKRDDLPMSRMTKRNEKEETYG